MAKPKYPEGSEQPGGPEKPRRDKDGRERIVHLEIAARRFAGGAAPTPEAYARAMEQWRQLPGAVQHLPVNDLAGAPDSAVPRDVDAETPPPPPKPPRQEG